MSFFLWNIKDDICHSVFFLSIQWKSICPGWHLYFSGGVLAIHWQNLNFWVINLYKYLRSVSCMLPWQRESLGCARVACWPEIRPYPPSPRLHPGHAGSSWTESYCSWPAPPAIQQRDTVLWNLCAAYCSTGHMMICGNINGTFFHIPFWTYYVLKDWITELILQVNEKYVLHPQLVSWSSLLLPVVCQSGLASSGGFSCPPLSVERTQSLLDALEMRHTVFLRRHMCFCE